MIEGIKNNLQQGLRDLKAENEAETLKLKIEHDTAVQNAQLKNKKEETLATISAEARRRAEANQIKQEKGLVQESGRGDINRIRSENETQLQKLHDQYQSDTQRRKTLQNQEIAAITGDLNEQKQKVVESAKQALQTQDVWVKSQIDQKARQSANRLDRVSQKLNDPFYQPPKLAVQVNESHDQFTIRVAVPEYERDRLRSSFSGDHFVVSVARQSETESKDPEGGVARSNQMQTISQSIELGPSIFKDGLIREEAGDQVIFTVPKRLGPLAKKETTHVPSVRATSTTLSELNAQDIQKLIHPTDGTYRILAAK